MNEPLVCEAWDRRARGAMLALGVKTWDDLSRLSDFQLLTVKGVGRDTLAYINRKLRERGVGRAPSGAGALGVVLPEYQPTRGVYFVVADGFVKIGHSKDIRHRFGAIAQMNPHPCELVAVIGTQSEHESRDVERSLHGRFKDQRHRLEWFHYTPEIEAYVCSLNRQRAAA
jgi:hypothetical protein